jgi:DNA-binding NarL/FixJ family response regulator
MDGITTLPEIKKLYPDIRVIMLTMHNDHSMITKLMELGANSYLTKNSDPELIYEAIKTVHEEEFFFNQLTNKALIDGLKMKRQIESNMPVDAKLNEKEIAILRMICEEKSTKEIADIVELSPRTVEAIRDKLKVKTGAKSMAGLVMYAVKSGIIQGAPESDS